MGGLQEKLVGIILFVAFIVAGAERDLFLFVVFIVDGEFLFVVFIVDGEFFIVVLVVVEVSVIVVGGGFHTRPLFQPLPAL